MKVARQLPRHLTVSENSRKDIVAQMGVDPDTLHIVPVGVDQTQFRLMPHVARVPGRLMTTASADVPLKGLTYLIEALAKVRTERPDAHLVVIGQPRHKSAVPAQIERLGLQGAIEFVSGVSDERIVELYGEAEIAVDPVAVRRFLAARDRGDGVRRPARDHDRWRAARSGRPSWRERDARAARRPGCARGADRRRPERRQRCGASSPKAAGAACSTVSPGGAPRKGPPSTTTSNSKRTRAGSTTPECAELLTVDFDRLGLVRGERLLDLGAGRGRHLFEGMRRGARVTALDYSAADLKDAAAVAGAMLAGGEVGIEAWAGAVNGDALQLPFADDTFDRIVVSEVLEHIWDDERAIVEIVRVLRPGGRVAATVPTRWPERVSWALNYEYHDTPGGHVRIYRQRDLERKLERAGLFLRGSHHAHAFHSPYWWLKCAYGLDNTEAAPVKRYHEFLCGLIERNPRWAARTERALNPVLGKSLVVYGEKVPAAMARWGKRSLD